MKDLLRRLAEFGMSDKEASTYLSMLELGPASAQDIAKKSGVNRATTYVMIESLKRRGLVSSVERGKKTHYSAESPNHLKAIVEHEVRDASEKRERLMSTMPQFLALFNAVENKPKVRYFEGDEGLYACREAAMQMAKKGEMWRQFIHIDKETDSVRERHQEHSSQVYTVSPHLRILYSLEPGLTLPTFPREVTCVQIPESIQPFAGECDIFSTFIVILNHNVKSIGVLIESEEVARLCQSMFDLAWMTAEPKKMSV